MVGVFGGVFKRLQDIDELFRLYIKQAGLPVVGGAPDISVLAFHDSTHTVTAECVPVFLGSLISFKCITVILAQPIPCTEPDKSVLVLQHTHNITLGKTVINGKVFHLTHRLCNDGNSHK